MIYVKKVAGFSTKDLARKNDKKYFKKTAKGISVLDRLSERRVFRDALAEKARDKKGININEMADIVTEQRYNKKDRITKQEASVVAKHFGISERRLLKAKKRYLEGLHNESNESKGNIAKPYGQREEDDDDRLALRGRAQSGDEDISRPSSSVARRPMF
jgi:hypothetical protein